MEDLPGVMTAEETSDTREFCEPNPTL